MEFLKSLFSGGSSDDSEICPTCGAPLFGDGDGRYECHECNHVSFMENGVIVDASQQGNNDGECEVCQGSLAGGDFTAPWENGDNAYAFVSCRHCGHENIKYGFGGDD